MTFVSLADASRCLFIDVKTLRRWLTDAQLPLQNHRSDGRKKGVSTQHLELLAKQHQRRLTPLSSHLAPPVPAPVPPLPAALLALPEQLGTLQAQIAALQQQVADLAHLMMQHRPEPALLLPLPSTASPQPKPTRSAQSSRLAARATTKTQKSPTHVIPRVEYGPEGRYVVICPKKGLLPLEPDTKEWFAWLREHDSFRFVGRAGHFTAHHEWRVKNGAWRAHRHIRNHVYTRRLAKREELTIAVLEQAAVALSAHLT